MKWISPEEVTTSGMYLLHRTDDDNMETRHACCMVSVLEFKGRLVTREFVPLSSFDTEVRLFGPIPNLED